MKIKIYDIFRNIIYIYDIFTQFDSFWNFGHVNLISQPRSFHNLCLQRTLFNFDRRTMGVNIVLIFNEKTLGFSSVKIGFPLRCGFRHLNRGEAHSILKRNLRLKLYNFCLVDRDDTLSFHT